MAPSLAVFSVDDSWHHPLPPHRLHQTDGKAHDEAVGVVGVEDVGVMSHAEVVVWLDVHGLAPDWKATFEQNKVPSNVKLSLSLSLSLLSLSLSSSFSARAPTHTHAHTHTERDAVGGWQALLLPSFGWLPLLFLVFSSPSPFSLLSLSPPSPDSLALSLCGFGVAGRWSGASLSGLSLPLQSKPLPCARESGARGVAVRSGALFRLPSHGPTNSAAS